MYTKKKHNKTQHNKDCRVKKLETEVKRLEKQNAVLLEALHVICEWIS